VFFLKFFLKSAGKTPATTECHICEFSDKFLRSSLVSLLPPGPGLKVGDRLPVWVLSFVPTENQIGIGDKELTDFEDDSIENFVNFCDWKYNIEKNPESVK